MAHSELTSLNLAEAAGLVRRREISPLELTSAHLERIEALDQKLNSFITVTAESALSRAKQAESELHKGETLAGKPLSLLKDKEITLLRRHNVGFVFQFFNLLPTLTTEENITLPLIIDGKNPRQYQERLDNLLSLVGLSERRNHKPDQLSGGEQQRVSLARALITEPEILLADEPTGNLDSKTGISIMELLRLSRDELGQTIVVVTHDARAAAYADRVVFLRDGKIATHKEIDAQATVQDNLKSIMAEIESLET